MTSTKLRLTLALLLAAGLAACAGTKTAGTPEPTPQPKVASAGPGDQAAPVMVGSDIIANLSKADTWALLSDTDNWGAWNKKVTAVAHTAGLNTGADLSYRWEEKDVQASVTAVKEAELLEWKGARAGKDVLLRWSLTPLDPHRTVVSLRAVLKNKASETLIANASNEVQSWMGPLQEELTRRAPAPAPEAAKPAKKRKKAAPQASPAPAAKP